MKKTLEHIICFLILFWIVFLLGGCVKKEITRQADWKTHFTDIHFADAKHGWIVGHGGWILHTADGGVNWEKQTVNTNEDLKAVYFTNRRNGWAVGDKGRIATTDDGGLHWTVEKSKISTLFLDVFFLNSKTGWIAGQDGLQYTQNGGKTWHHQQTSEFGLKGIHFVDKQRGWTVGDYAESLIPLMAAKHGGDRRNSLEQNKTRRLFATSTQYTLQHLMRGGVVAQMAPFFIPATAVQSGTPRTADSHRFMDIYAQPSTISISLTRTTVC